MKRYIKRFCGLLVLSIELLSLFAISTPGSAYNPNLFVSSDGSGDCSQSAPCRMDQALAAAAEDDRIYFKEGTYTSSVFPYLTINKPVSLLGGWDGAATGDIVVDPAAYETVLDAEEGGSIFAVYNAAGGRITISGFTFQNGNSYNSGGAIYVNSGMVDIINNGFNGNQADDFGGAIAVDAGEDVRIIGNSFANNEAQYGGGNIYLASSNPETTVHRVEHNKIYGGLSNYGAAIHVSGVNAVINANLIQGTGGYSAISTSGQLLTITNNFIVRPEWVAIDLSGSSSLPHRIFHNTIIGNGTSSSGGVVIASGVSAEVSNTIITNTNNSIRNFGNLTGTNNLFYNNTNDPVMTNTVSEDPLFVDAVGDDYHLTSDSPAVNAGATVTVSEDFDGESRPSGGGYDIGADEIVGDNMVFIPLLLR